ncbi:hypothetical protein ACG3SL_05100 [Sphingomonas sp. CJ20]
MRTLRTAIFCLGLLAASAPAAQAQEFSPNYFGWSTIIPSFARTDILGTHLRELERQDAARAAARRGRAAPAT